MAGQRHPRTIFTLGFLFFFSLLQIGHANAALLSLEPDASSASPGDTVAIDLVVSGLGDFTAPALGAFSAEIAFDPAAIAFSDYLLGGFLGDATALESVDVSTGVSAGIVGLGEVSFLASHLLEAQQPDWFILATLTFDILSLAPGQQTLLNILPGALLADANGAALPVTATNNASLRAPLPAPAPATPLLFVTGLLALCVRRRYAPRAYAGVLAALALCFSTLSYGQCGDPVPLMCDADADRDVDSADIAAIGQANGSPATFPVDVRDIDGDGTITILDARQCVARCDEALCSIPADPDAVYAAANSCVAITPDGGQSFIAQSSSPPGLPAASYRLSSTAGASRFLLRPSDLGQFLLFDEAGHYMTSDGSTLQRAAALESDTRVVGGSVQIEPDKQSEGEWRLEAAVNGQFRLHHLLSGKYVAADGSMAPQAQAATLDLVAQSECATFPELSLDATGAVSKTAFDDGAVFGFVETHAHLFTNKAFGGGGTFHGAPFHPLGVEHALPDCDLVHGTDGRKDIMGAGFAGGDIAALLPALLTGELAEKNHDTEGYPVFTDWPNAPSSATHQVQYYKWIERAWLSGLRLMVQHATTNQFLCELVVGIDAQPERHSCNDMVNVDKILEDTRHLERYIDALHGGPGQGWFRIVESPEDARREIRAGNLAVILGIETSVLFDCFLVPFGDFSPCTEADVVAKLDEYYDRGVRVLFPVHKYDNGFSAGDGDRGIIDIGNFGHTGHFNNYVECPAELLTFPGGFDDGGVPFGGLNQPREIYDSPPPIDMSGLPDNVVGTLLPFLGLLAAGPLEGEYCQNHGLTPLGEFLIREMMKRGMIIEVDHLPRKSYKRAYEMLVENDYPAMGTHGRNNNGLLYELGGKSKFNFGRCRNPNQPSTLDDNLQARVQLMRERGAYPSEGFGFDLNGFAGAPGPRFGPASRCTNQTDAGVTYPFTSYAGDVTFARPVVGDRTLDFNTEGMVHLGLVAELIEDVRRDGVTDAELEPLFKSAEGYLRVWEKSIARSATIGTPP